MKLESNKGHLRMMIDTGATDSLVNEGICRPAFITNLSQPIKIKSISGTTIIDKKAVVPNTVFKFPTKTDTTFFITKFHDKYDGLLGMNILKDCEINMQEGFIKTNNVMLPIFFNTNNEKEFEGKLKTLNEMPSLEINYIEDIKEKLFEKVRLDHLNHEETAEIKSLIKTYKHVFFQEGQDLTFTNKVKHNIPTKDESPIYTRPYRYPEIYKEEIEKQMLEMLEQGIIKNSVSPYCAPVWVVPKKEDASGKKKFRIVIDTVEDKYPLPNMDSIQVRTVKIFYNY